MSSSFIVPLLVVVIVSLLGIIIVQRSTRKARHVGKGHHRKKVDHGAQIATLHGMVRSPEWPRVAHEHLQREPACVACGHKGKHLQVHHIKPFHLHPHLELDPDNLITLCEAPGREHHLLLGHLDAWNSYNEHIRADAKHFYRKTANQIRADLHWQKKMSARPT